MWRTGVSFTSTAGMTGVSTYSMPLKVIVEGHKEYVLTTKKPLKQFDITSVGISGRVIGEGNAKIYIENEVGEQLLIYSSEKEVSDFDLITGMGKGVGKGKGKGKSKDKKKDKGESEEERILDGEEITEEEDKSKQEKPEKKDKGKGKKEDKGESKGEEEGEAEEEPAVEQGDFVLIPIVSEEGTSTPTTVTEEPGDQIELKSTFDNECAETCFIETGTFEGDSYKLIIEVDEGTKLEIEEIIFSAV